MQNEQKASQTVNNSTELNSNNNTAKDVKSNAEVFDDGQYQPGVSAEDYDVEKAIGADVPEQTARRLEQMGEHMSADLEARGKEDYVRYKVPGTHDDVYEKHMPSLDMLDKLAAAGVHDELYEKHMPSLDLLNKLADEQIKPDEFTESEAEHFAARQGLESVIRENARLNEDLRRADKARKRSAFVTIVLSGVLISMLWAFMSYPKNKYIATMDNQAICPVDAANNPNITDVQIANFAQSAATQLYTMDYVNYPDQVEATLSRYFTSQGRVDAVASFEEAGTLTNVATNALTLRAGATHAPRIEEKGIGSDGAPYWVVRFPMVLDIYSGESTPKESKRYIVSVRLRSDTASASNPTGLGVLTINLIPDTNTKQ